MKSKWMLVFFAGAVIFFEKMTNSRLGTDGNRFWGTCTIGRDDDVVAKNIQINKRSSYGHPI
jgi:hypothetical protein